MATRPRKQTRPRRSKRTFTRDDQIVFRVPSHLKRALEQHSANTSRDMSDYMISYLRDGLKNDGVIRQAQPACVESHGVFAMA